MARCMMVIGEDVFEVNFKIVATLVILPVMAREWLINTDAAKTGTIDLSTIEKVREID